MADGDAAISKVEDALAEVLRMHPPLSDWTIVTDLSVDEAIQGDGARQVLIYTTALSVARFDDQSQTLHEAMVNFEVVNGDFTVGLIGRTAHAVIAHIIGAIAQDRTIGGMLQSIEEQDVAGTEANGKDVGSASLQMRAQFFTSRDDWFTIIGPAGQTF